jgi:hypothetical protein
MSDIKKMVMVHPEENNNQNNINDAKNEEDNAVTQSVNTFVIDDIEDSQTPR